MIFDISLTIIASVFILTPLHFLYTDKRERYRISQSGNEVRIIEQIEDSCFDEEGRHFWIHELGKV